MDGEYACHWDRRVGFESHSFHLGKHPGHSSHSVDVSVYNSQPVPQLLYNLSRSNPWGAIQTIPSWSPANLCKLLILNVYEGFSDFHVRLRSVRIVESQHTLCRFCVDL